MNELYYTKPYRRSIRTLRLAIGEVNDQFLLNFIDVEIYLNGKSEFSPIEKVYDDEQEMLKNVWETRKQLSDERWILRTKEESPTSKQTSFITLKTNNGDLSLEFDN